MLKKNQASSTSKLIISMNIINKLRILFYKIDVNTFFFLIWPILILNEMSKIESLLLIKKWIEFVSIWFDLIDEYIFLSVRESVGSKKKWSRKRG